MCLLFLYVNDDPKPDAYRVILANNRDEYWDRPTLPLSFWEHQPHCLGGQDWRFEDFGSTWLGMSRKGRIGVLLDILEKRTAKKQTRGKLISNYLTSTLSGKAYINNCVAPVQHSFNGFQLLLLDISSDKHEISYFNNKYPDQDIRLSDGFCCLCNSLSPMKPWLKVKMSSQVFKTIVKNWNFKETKYQLLQNLEEMLLDGTEYPDDPILADQAKHASLDIQIRNKRSATFVFSPSDRSGTRTQSFILIDSEGRCDFIEKTLQTPVDPNALEWQTRTFSFELLKN